MIYPKFDNETGLVPAIISDVHTHEVLMLAYMNKEAFEKTVETKQTWFWSRSRQEYWHKGETSGNTQSVVEIKIDCDLDTLVVMVEKRDQPVIPATKVASSGQLIARMKRFIKVAENLKGSYRLERTKY